MPHRQRLRWGVLLVVVAAIIWWVLADGVQPPEPGSTTAPGSAATQDRTTATDDADQDSDTDSQSGLPIVQVADLPPQAADIVALIDRGGPFGEDEDGGTFENREERLPDQGSGYYREYTVPTPGSDDRGARRIVTGEGGEFYWTGDHYRSFSRIAR